MAMADAGLLDLENRKGKAPGGYSTSLNFRKMPLIFMNAVGIDDDVRTLLHESGHAFHSFEASRLPLLFQRHPGSEMAEVASMSMELLASPFLDLPHGGYYSEQDARGLTVQAGQMFPLRIELHQTGSISGTVLFTTNR